MNAARRRLAVCADTVFLELPFVERARAIARAGFEVEFWRWQGRDLDALADDPAVVVSAFTGYLGGSIVDPGGVDAFLAGARESLEPARRLGVRDLFVSTGELGPNGEVVHAIAPHPATRWITAYRALSELAELAEENEVAYHLEHLNTRLDHPGYPLPRVEDVVRLLEEVGSPRIRLLLDVYHVQVQEESLAETIRAAAPFVGHVHVADAPGRHEPGTGGIDFGEVARTLDEVGYRGVIALEAYPEQDAATALARFRDAFVNC